MVKSNSLQQLKPQRIPKLRPLKLRGIRMRKWGKWVSEVRMPNSRGKIWLGSYDTAEQAARAYDFAVYCFRGPHARFNFPISPSEMPSISSLSQREIQAAAANFALRKFPLAPGVKMAAEAETEMLCPVSEIGSAFAQEIMSKNEVGFWESVLNGNESESNEVVKMEMAARPYDFAVYCFRGPHARFNFPISPSEMPSITSLSQREIQATAANFALQKFPLVPGVKLAAEAETEMLWPVSEIGSSYAQEIVSENEVGFWESVLNGNEAESDEVVKMEMAALAHLPTPSPVRVTVDQVE